MGNYLEDQPQGLSGIPAEFLVYHLYIEGYITDEEFKKWINDNSYKPHIEKIKFNNFRDDFHDKIRRIEVAETKENLVTLNLDFFV